MTTRKVDVSKYDPSIGGRLLLGGRHPLVRCPPFSGEMGVRYLFSDCEFALAPVEAGVPSLYMYIRGRIDDLATTMMRMRECRKQIIEQQKKLRRGAK